MKTYKNHVILLFLIICFSPAFAQTSYKAKATKLNIAGTSSLHDWVSEATQVEWSGAFDVQDKKVVQVKDVRVKILVKSIKSEKGGTMDDKTYEAFKSDKNPNITYAFQNAKISGSGSDFTLETIGALQMAGATKNIDMTVKAKMLANGDIQLTGSKKINMTEFGMKPPTAVLGTIKVGPEVTINFDFTVTPTKQLP
jgi:polyisoprenoid-binding protein YceI